ncbi:MAG: hypothetical protein ACREOD_07655 [Candidatus Dormibacteria bacterium]
MLRALGASIGAAVLAMAITGCGGGGQSAPLHRPTAPLHGPTAREVQSETLKAAHNNWEEPSAASALCFLPSAWTPGKKFECFVNDSKGNTLGVVTATVVATRGTKYDWHEVWAPSPISTPTATPTPLIYSPPPSVPIPTAPANVVTFTVTGSAPVDEFGDTVSIAYGSDTANDAGGTSVPWSAILPLGNPKTDSNLEYNLSASLTGAGGNISCSIAVKGKVIGTNTAEGADQSCYIEISPNLFGTGWSVD